MKHLMLALLLMCSVASAESLVSRGEPKWHPGAEDCTPETTRTEFHEFDDGLLAFRQNPCVDHEANLVYLLRGSERVLLIDTGAVEGAAAVPLVELARQAAMGPDGTPMPLLIVHTHGHRDHFAGDAAFAALPNAKIASPLQGSIDLGDREIQVIATPGHLDDHVVFYDPRLQSLFTGDFLLPGRLLVDDIDAYRDSAQRVADFVKTHPVQRVFGAHIEMDEAGNPYPGGSTFHPNERGRPMTASDVEALPAALAGFNGFYSRYPNFVVVNPVHNLIALATGIIAVLVLLGWIARRLWKRRRAVTS